MSKSINPNFLDKSLSGKITLTDGAGTIIQNGVIQTKKITTKLINGITDATLANITSLFYLDDTNNTHVNYKLSTGQINIGTNTFEGTSSNNINIGHTSSNTNLSGTINIVDSTGTNTLSSYISSKIPTASGLSSYVTTDYASKTYVTTDYANKTYLTYISTEYTNIKNLFTFRTGYDYLANRQGLHITTLKPVTDDTYESSFEIDFNHARYLKLGNDSATFTNNIYIGGYTTEVYVKGKLFLYNFDKNASQSIDTYITSKISTEYLTTDYASKIYLTTDYASKTYLTTDYASQNYQTISSMSSYLTTTSASSTYLKSNDDTYTNIKNHFYLHDDNIYVTFKDSTKEIYIGTNTFEGISNSNILNIGHQYTNTILYGVIKIGGTADSNSLSNYVLNTISASKTYLTTDYASKIYLTTDYASKTYLTTDYASKIYLTTDYASKTYLTTTYASNTYQTINGMSSYLTTTSASNTYQTVGGMSSYLTTTSASNTYLKSNDDTYTNIKNHFYLDTTNNTHVDYKDSTKQIYIGTNTFEGTNSNIVYIGNANTNTILNGAIKITDSTGTNTLSQYIITQASTDYLKKSEAFTKLTSYLLSTTASSTYLTKDDTTFTNMKGLFYLDANGNDTHVDFKNPYGIMYIGNNVPDATIVSNNTINIGHGNTTTILWGTLKVVDSESTYTMPNYIKKQSGITNPYQIKIRTDLVFNYVVENFIITKFFEIDSFDNKCMIHLQGGLWLSSHIFLDMGDVILAGGGRFCFYGYTSNGVDYPKKYITYQNVTSLSADQTFTGKNTFNGEVFIGTKLLQTYITDQFPDYVGKTKTNVFTGINTFNNDVYIGSTLLQNLTDMFSVVENIRTLFLSTIKTYTVTLQPKKRTDGSTLFYINHNGASSMNIGTEDGKNNTVTIGGDNTAVYISKTFYIVNPITGNYDNIFNLFARKSSISSSATAAGTVSGGTLLNPNYATTAQLDAIATVFDIIPDVPLPTDPDELVGIPTAVKQISIGSPSSNDIVNVNGMTVNENGFINQMGSFPDYSFM